MNFVGGWSLYANNRYNPHEQEIASTDATALFTRYNEDSISFGYHFNQPNTSALAEDGSERLEDLTIESFVHLSDQWTYTQEADYSRLEGQMKSWESSVEYESDCWSLGMKIGSKLSSDDEVDKGYYVGLIFSLKGLTEYGK